MGRELEVKILNIDKHEVERKLVDIGAELVKRELQVNSVYDYPDGSFERERRGYIRIREIKDLCTGAVEYEFTIKKIISNDGIKEYEEIETKVEDKESLGRMLLELGLSKKHEGYKERTRYKLGNIVYDIDTWDEATVPYPYLEIEVESKEDLKRAIELIGASESDISLKTIRELKAEAEAEKQEG